MNTIHIKHLFALLLSFSVVHSTIAQVEFYPNISDPNSPAILDVQSTDKGVLIPPMTSMPREAISN